MLSLEFTSKENLEQVTTFLLLQSLENPLFDKLELVLNDDKAVSDSCMPEDVQTANSARLEELRSGLSSSSSSSSSSLPEQSLTGTTTAVDFYLSLLHGEKEDTF